MLLNNVLRAQCNSFSQLLKNFYAIKYLIIEVYLRTFIVTEALLLKTGNYTGLFRANSETITFIFCNFLRRLLFEKPGGSKWRRRLELGSQRVGLTFPLISQGTYFSQTWGLKIGHQTGGFKIFPNFLEKLSSQEPGSSKVTEQKMSDLHIVCFIVSGGFIIKIPQSCST